MLEKEPKELLSLQENEITPIVRKLNTLTKNVREDIAKKKISEAEGEKLILKAAMTISLLTNGYRQTFPE